MPERLNTRVGRVELKNPLIAALGRAPDRRRRRAPRARGRRRRGRRQVDQRIAGRASDQLQRAEYMLLDERLAAGAVGTARAGVRDHRLPLRPDAAAVRRLAGADGRARPRGAGARLLCGRQPDPGRTRSGDRHGARRSSRPACACSSSISARPMRARRAAWSSTELDPARVATIVARACARRSDPAVGQDHRPERARARARRGGVRGRRRGGGHGRPPARACSRRRDASSRCSAPRSASAGSGTCR